MRVCTIYMRCAILKIGLNSSRSIALCNTCSPGEPTPENSNAKIVVQPIFLKINPRTTLISAEVGALPRTGESGEGGGGGPYF